jgi:hypothetical protein
VINLVFFLEELSARAMLEGLLPRLLPCLMPSVAVNPFYIVFEGKTDLKTQLSKRLQGWLTPNSVFFVLCDKDSNDCVALKQEIKTLIPPEKQALTLIRIACHELESFYLGDLQAVETAFTLPGVAKKQVSAKFRDPDKLGNPVQELTRLSKGRYQKVSGSALIGRCLSLNDNRSGSFNVLLTGLTQLLQVAPLAQ